MAIFPAICFLAVTAAMAIDFVTGIRKAKALGTATRSKGFRMTSEKAGKYFLPILCLACIDCLTANFTAFPFLTSLMAAFNIFCEWRSIFESTHDKAEIRDAANTIQVIVKNKEDFASTFSELLNSMARRRHPRSRKNHAIGTSYQSVEATGGAGRRSLALLLGVILCSGAMLSSCGSSRTSFTEHLQENERVTSNTFSLRQIIASDSFDLKIGTLEFVDSPIRVPSFEDDMYSVPRKSRNQRNCGYFRATNLELIRHKQIASNYLDTINRKVAVSSFRESEMNEVTEPPSGVSGFCSYTGYIALLAVFFVAVVICLKFYNVLVIRSK